MSFNKVQYLVSLIQRSTLGRMLPLNLCEGDIASCSSTLNVMFFWHVFQSCISVQIFLTWLRDAMDEGTNLLNGLHTAV